MLLSTFVGLFFIGQDFFHFNAVSALIYPFKHLSLLTVALKTLSHS